MKSVRIAVLMTLLAAPVHAQSLGTNIIPDAPSKTPEQLERDQLIERNYKEGLKKIPDAKASNDPWGSVRSAETPRTAAKTSEPKTSATAPKSLTPKAPNTSQGKPAAVSQ